MLLNFELPRIEMHLIYQIILSYGVSIHVDTNSFTKVKPSQSEACSIIEAVFFFLKNMGVWLLFLGLEVKKILEY